MAGVKKLFGIVFLFSLRFLLKVTKQRIPQYAILLRIECFHSHINVNSCTCNYLVAGIR